MKESERGTGGERGKGGGGEEEKGAEGVQMLMSLRSVDYLDRSRDDGALKKKIVVIVAHSAEMMKDD